MNRKRKSVILWLSLLLLLAVMAAGCSKKPCEVHADENKDGVCDACGESVICATHTDEDGNLTCDVCGLAITPICELHVDKDGNLTCDVCGAAVTATCDPHKDANADRVCDMCGGAIVVITEYIAPKDEVRVAPVVNPIPSDVPVGSYLKTAPKSGALTVGGAFPIYAGNRQSGRYLYTATTSDEGTMTTHLILDLATGETRLRTVLATAETYEISLYADFYRIHTQNENSEAVYSYYSYKGTCFFENTVPRGSAPWEFFEDYTAIPGYLRLTLGDRYYVIDSRTDEYLFALDAKTFVARPAFSVTNERFGYVEMNDALYVYDLTQWLSCAVSYEIPSYYENVRWFVLENGCALLQAEVRESDRSGNYDFVRTDGAAAGKYDLRYVMIDPVAKTAKAVEFGYWILSVDQPSGTGVFADTVLNRMWVYPIEEDRINTHGARELIVDNSLGVLYDCGATLDATDGMAGVRVVGDNLYLLRTVYNNGVIRRVVNEKGEHVTYLPEGAVEREGYVEYGGRFYTYRMEAIAEGFVADDGLMNIHYRILSKTGANGTEYYFFNGSDPVQIALEGASITLLCDAGFAVSGIENGETVYRFYNIKGEKILDGSARIQNIVPMEEDVSAYILTDTAGNQYVIR